MEVRVKKAHIDAIIPQDQNDGDSGFDLHCINDVTLFPGETSLVDTGLIFEIPRGYEIQIRPRSGLSLKTALRINNAPGTIDFGYRSQVGLICSNVGSDILTFNKHSRLAQGVLCPVVKAQFKVVDELTSTSRGTNGLGSTGI